MAIEVVNVLVNGIEVVNVLVNGIEVVNGKISKVACNINQN